MEIQNEIDEQFKILRKNYPGRELQITRLQDLIGDVRRHDIYTYLIILFLFYGE